MIIKTALTANIRCQNLVFKSAYDVYPNFGITLFWPQAKEAHKQIKEIYRGTTDPSLFTGPTLDLLTK